MAEAITRFNPSAASALEMARRIENKDPYTAGHTWRVANYGQILAAELGYKPAHMEAVVLSGTLHDIGKISVPDEILTKPERLTDEEFEIIKKHPQDGFELLNDVPEFKEILNVVLMHHEAFDGGGYPFGLSGEDIPHEARLFAVVDAFDAMTSNRCYRSALAGDNAIYEIWRNRGRQFDPQIADAFQQLFHDGLLDHIVGHSDFGVKIGRCPRCGPVIELRNEHHIDDEVICSLCASRYKITSRAPGDVDLTFIGTLESRTPWR